jgi:carbon-monoxide dehydrogenase medium subunit
MYAFDYQRPDSVAAAASLLSASEEAKLLAGGQTLIPTMKLRLASPGEIIDLSRIADLKGIELKGNSLVIGATTTHATVANSPVVKQAIPALADLAQLIGDPAVRHRGTIGGSLANNDPAADYPAAALALGATITTNKRDITADDYFTGLFETALEPGEIITKVSFPKTEKAGYAKFRNPASRFALVGVFVAKSAAGVRVSVTGAGSSGVFRVPELETALAANFSADALAGIKLGTDGINADIHADAAYRAHLIVVMAKRAVAAAH